MATLDKQAVRLMAEEIARAIKKLNEENNRTYVNTQIANSASASAKRANIANTITGNINSSQVNGLEGVISGLIGSADPDSPEGSDAQIIYDAIKGIIEIEADSVVADSIITGELNSTVIDAIVANINKVNSNITNSEIVNAIHGSFDTVKIKWGDLETVTAETVIGKEGAFGLLTISQLKVDEANIVNLTVGNLMIRDSEGNLVRLAIKENDDGTQEVVTEECSSSAPVNGSFIANETLSGEKIITDSIIARHIKASQIEGIHLNVPSVTTKLITSDVAEDELQEEWGDNPFSRMKSSIELNKGYLGLIISVEEDGIINEETSFILTDNMIRAIADKISFEANEKIILTVGDSKMEIDPEGLDTVVGNTKSFTSVKQTAEGVATVIVGDNGVTTVEFTDNAVNAMSEQINISAEKINAIANEINLEGNETVKITSPNQIELESDELDIVIGGSTTIKALSDNISSTVNNLEGNISELEQTAEKFEASLESKIGEDELKTYLRYSVDDETGNGTLELGQDGSDYVTQTSNRGFEVLYKNAPMTSIKQNTVSAPIVHADRMFTIGEYTIRSGVSGHLIFN